MNSPLGEYIHLNAQNYLDYGINRIGGNKSNDFSIQLSKQKELHNSRLNSLNIKNVGTIIKELNSRFNLLVEKKYIQTIQQQNLPAEDKIVEEVQKGFVNFLNTWFGSEISNIESSQLSIQSMQELFNKIARARENINEALKRLNKEGYRYKEQTLGTIKKNLNNIKQAIIEALKIKNKINTEGKLNINFEEDKPLQKFYDDLSKLALIKKSNENLQGKKGEKIAALLQYNIEKLIIDSINNINNQEGIVGEDRTTISYKESDAFLGKTDTVITVGKTQDKVDVSFQINNTPLNISVKNYYSNTDTIYPELQEVNLFYTLLNTADKFGTHWINLHALVSKNLTKNKKEADEALQEQIKFEALVSGNLLKQRQAQNPAFANFFIGLDSKNEKFRIVDTKTLLKKDIFTFSPKIQSLNKFTNRRGSDVNERINNILLNLQKEKITVRAKIQLSTIAKGS